MGTGRWALPWALWVLLLVPKADTQQEARLSRGGSQTPVDPQRIDFAQQLTFVPQAILFPTISPPNPAHNGRVCSTWGDFHYKTFDGTIFRFPGLCNYVLSAHCGGAYEDFNVQLRRGVAGARPAITHVVLRSQGLVLEASKDSVLVDGRRVELPFGRAGLLVERSGSYIKVSVRLVLTFMWNGEDSALLELDPKYSNQTCGLCGDFNGLPVANEFFAHNARLTPLQFGNLQKMDGPTEQCQDPLPSAADNCTDEEDFCRRTLLGPAFGPCHALLDPEAYVAACTQELCRCPSCPCATFAEYSRQCAHAGGRPQDWRRPDLCPATCPRGMRHLECGSPCADTCSNPERAQLCEDHCVDGCFCPEGTVWDDVGKAGCVPLEQCSCTHGGRTYAPGASFTSSCSSCTCSGGRWQCQDLPCPGTCSVQGGAHVSTYDEKLYDLHGDCSYILSKRCTDASFTVLAELRKCGLTDTENCLKAVTLILDGGDTTIRIQSNGGVFMNSIYTQLPVSAANITIFKPTSFFIVLSTALGLQLQVQLVPLMQVFLQLLPEHRGQMCGLCGNFNQNQADDFRALSGVVEGTAAAFANTWKTQAACPNVRSSFEDPCSLSVENENYAQHWCSLLTHPAGAFAACHSVVNPSPFHSNCLFDTCNCERSEDCMCAALSAYVRACAARGVLLTGWRDGVCTKYMSDCPKSQRYTYVADRCQPTCRALSQADVTCAVDFVPVDGCTCPPGTFLDDSGACVPAQACPCYFRGSVVAPGEVVHDNGVVCSCSNGKLDCLGASEKSSDCVAPMVYLDCSNASAGTPGAECLRSCHTLDVDCFSTHCVSGCVCPPGLVSDGNGGCVAEEDCPCLHNDASYRPGDTIRVDCNTCTCKNRRWECSERPCLGTCVAYGDGHFLTFDGERYSFEGSCEYTLAQDHCGSGSANGTFRIITENVPCGTTGVTCSRAIKIFLESHELILHEGTHRVVQRGPGEELPYKVRLMGIYLVVETRLGLVVSWDRKTSVFIRLRQDYKGRVCGLCGNFDDKAINDFTTRGQSVVGSALEFGNSWKFSPSCPDAPVPRDPCAANPYRRSWAQKQCSLINSATFAACHAQVEPSKYYEACVSDACACDSGGDCECFCTAVGAYAQACRDVGVCVSWRTPDICPLFCDYYNPHGGCEWHYQPCGAPCLKTCRNPSGRCLMDLPGLEGCYPKCPPSKPFFSEEQMSCVAQCGCYDEQDNYYEIGTSVPTTENCQRCHCTPAGRWCTHSPEACTCVYEGRTYGYKEVIYNTTDGLGGCLLAICGDNGTIIRTAVECPEIPATTPFTFTTTAAPPPTTSRVPTFSTVCVRELCQWSDWYDSSRPQPGMGGGDFETLVELRRKGYSVCEAPVDIECRAQQLPSLALEELGQKVDCSPARGLTCLNSEQSPPRCHNYEVRLLCCDYVPCATSPAPGTPRPTPSHTTLVPSPATQATPIWDTSSSQTLSAVPSTSRAPEATSCQPRCQWTQWFDTDYPLFEEAGGDMETYDRIRRAGGDVCAQPQDIECRAENFPDQTPEELGQRVHCDVHFGLECRNWEQPGLFKMCYNYRVRMLCCSSSHCGAPTTTARGVTSTTVSGVPTAGSVPSTMATTAHGVTSTTARGVSSTMTKVPSGATSTTAMGTMAITATSAMKPPATEPGTTPGRSPGSTEAPASLPTTLPSRAPTSTAGRPTSAPASAASVHPSHTTTQRVTAVSSAEPTPRVVTVQRSTTRPATGAQVGRTGTSPSPTETSTEQRGTVPATWPQPATTEATTSQGTTDCQPRCEWTEWLDVDFPTSGVTGGDMETFENIRAAGGRLCQEPQKIECRAENYPEVSIDQIGQVLTCSLRTGLICRNRDQKGPFTMCFNYNIRVLCCDDYRHCPSTAEPAHTRTATPGTHTSRPAPSPHTTTWGASSVRAETVSEVTANIRVTSGSPVPGTLLPTSLPSRPSQPGLSTPTLATSPSPGCEPQCMWTDWFDEDYPTPGPQGGDFETLAVLRAAGHVFCEQPQDIECRSQLEPQKPLKELGQVVQCDASVGLVCRNREQSQSWHYCHNYQVRLLCCDYSHCARSAATTATRAPTPATTSTPVVPTTMATSPGRSLSPEGSPGTTPPPSRTVTGTAPTSAKMGLSTSSLPPSPAPTATGSPGNPASTPSTSASMASSTPGPVRTTPLLTSVPPAASETPGAGTTACQPRCAWSDWLNESSPVPGATGGDFETYVNLRAAGWALCEQPVAVECRAAALPEVPLSELGQVVQCRLQDGLVCRNRDQAGRFKMCLDYQIRVLCCDYSHCPSTPATTATLAPSTYPGSPLPTSTSVLLSTVPSNSPAVTTSACQPACRWTDWLDSDHPQPGRYGGDIETYYNIQSVFHNQLCAEPVAIECEAVLFPGVPHSQLGQVVQCDVRYGLICRNSRQVWGRNCLNYHVRVQCCDDYSHCTSSPAPTTTSSTSTGQPTSEGAPHGTSGTTQMPPSSSVATSATKSTVQTGPTSPGATPGATKSTTQTGPSTPEARRTDSTTQTGSSSPRTTERVSVPGPSLSPTQPSVSTRPASSLASATAPTMTGHIQVTSGSLVPGTLSPTSLPSRPSQPGLSTPTLATSPSPSCEPQCMWTDWFDEDYPTPGPQGGDFETLAVLRAAGHVFCEQPQDIECRSQLEPQKPLKELGQVVQCDASVGLVCRNREQSQSWHYCHNYQVRLLCCDYSHCARSAATTATRAPTPATTSTPVVPTTMATSPGRSLSPEGSPGTTPPPSRTVTGTAPTSAKMGLSTSSLPPSPAPTATGSPGNPASTPSTSASMASSTPGPVRTTPLLTSVPPAASETPGAGTTACQPRCAWSDWLNESSPVPGATGGDFETYVNLRAAGRALCEQPVAVECRAAALPEVPLSELGQVVQCRLQDGLVCRNRDQAGRFKMCLDYQIRVLCCDYSHCPSTPATTATLAPSTYPGSPLPTSTSVLLSTVPSNSPAVTTSACQPACRWTDWLDSDQPLPGKYGGDIETYYNIQSVFHNQLCAEPVAIECEAVLFPGVPHSQLGQVVQCDVRYGLICRNSWQVWGRNCLNYHVRVQCCDDYSHCTSSPAPTTTSSTSTGQPTSEGAPHGTSGTTQMPPSSSVATSATKSTMQTGPTSPGATPGATKSTTETGPLSPGATPGATKSTTEITPSSPGTTPSATKSTTKTGPSSPGATPSATKSTTHTGPSSPEATPSTTKSITNTEPSSPGATSSATKSTTEMGPSSPGATPSAMKSTTHIGPSSPGVTPHAIKSTTETGPFSPEATPIATKSTTEIVPSSPGVIPSATKSTTMMGPSSPGATGSAIKSTTETKLSSPQSTASASKSTTKMGPSSPGTPGATKSTTETGPSSPGATPSATKSTTQAGFSSTGPTASATKSTTEIGPPSPRTTPSATKSTSETGPSSPGATPGTTKSTTQTGSSSSGATPSDTTSITKTGPSSPGATASATKSTTEMGPSTPGASPGPTKSTTETVSSHGAATSATFSTTGTGASTPTVIPWVITSNMETGPSSPGTTPSVTKSTFQTGPSSPRATPSVTESTTQTGAFSPRTTERVSVPGPSPTVHSMSTRPATAPVVTGHLQTTSGSPFTGTLSPTSLPSRPSQPGLSTPTLATSPSPGCEPQCMWTDWFDEDYPTPGPQGGDFETLAVLRAAGHVFCEQPQDIECRSEQEPQKPLKEVGQVVQCDASVGLVCRNREQSRPWHYCHNYHVRLLCCDYSHCATRAPTPATTSKSMVPTTRVTSPSQPDVSLSTAQPTVFSLEPTTTPRSPAPTSRCFCQAFGQLFMPGDVVYNQTDRAGCRFYAICNQHCEIDRFQDACPSPSPPTPSVSEPLPSPAPGCDLVDPPRQVNESWTLEDCTVARCEGHNHIVLLEPTPVAPVTCVNGRQPVKVSREDEPCDYHYECECSCSGWGSHYATFDGTGYSFSDNCTYILVREIRPQLGNLSVLLDNSFCEGSGPTARCSRALRVWYQSTEIILSTTTSPSGQQESLILFDQVRVTQSFSKHGVQVTAMAGTATSLVIPSVGVSITFDGQAFQIQLPYSHFHHNTEGQCGTCTNSQADDCRRPDGTIAPSCKDMASSWLFPESNKEGCGAPPSPPPTASPSSPAPTESTSTPCTPAPVCELLLSEVFAECRDLIPPEPFLSACLGDSCQDSHPAVPCQSLEAYAALCRGRGVCRDWRNATGGLCDLTCPPGKVYEPCGPAQPPTCDSRVQSPVSTALAEGCFCPEGQTLFNAYTDVCVPQCPCVGPDGYPKFPGEQWVSNCQECRCAGSPASVRCAPLPCPAQDLPPECGLAGFVPVTRPRATNPCCPETLCVCNTTTCPQNPPECGPQEELTRIQEGGNCCPTFTCRPKLCEHNGTVYGIGATFPAVTPCHTCTCLSMGTQEPAVHCEEDPCETTCPQGFQYSSVAGQCCGQCVQSACLAPSGGLIQPNETLPSSLDNCTEYHCEAENGLFLLTLRPTACPDVSSCRGVLRKAGCCYTCEEAETGSCHVRANTTVLQLGDCVTEVPVNVPFCEGSCPGMSRYSPDAQAMQSRCTCCRELRAHQQSVTLRCPDGTSIEHSYTHVDACGCEQACVPGAAPDGQHQLSSAELSR